MQNGYFTSTDINRGDCSSVIGWIFVAMALRQVASRRLDDQLPAPFTPAGLHRRGRELPKRLQGQALVSRHSPQCGLRDRETAMQRRNSRPYCYATPAAIVDEHVFRGSGRYPGSSASLPYIKGRRRSGVSMSCEPPSPEAHRNWSRPPRGGKQL